MTILVLGDSNTFGYELPDLPKQDIGWFGNEYFDLNQAKTIKIWPSQLSWPSQLGLLRKEEVNNLSVVGGSNDRIFRLAVSETVARNYDLVICAWTSLPRFDITYQDRELPFTANTPGLLKKMPWLNDYFKNHYSDKHMFERTINQILALQNHFKLIGQKFLFVDSIQIWFFPGIHDMIKPYVSLIDKKYYPTFWEDDFFSWTQHLPTQPGGHMSVEAHWTVAQRIYQYLLEIGL
jgi:hypothetical protein